jgi:hypothetical protein
MTMPQSSGPILQVAISPTFYEQLLCPNPFAKKIQTQIVSTEKLRQKLSYEKAAHKILVKLSTGLSNIKLFSLFSIDRTTK